MKHKASNKEVTENFFSYDLNMCSNHSRSYHFQTDIAFSYDVIIARLYRQEKILLVNDYFYSITTSNHRNQLKNRAEKLGYKIISICEADFDFRNNPKCELIIKKRKELKP